MKMRVAIAWFQDIFEEATKLMPAVDPVDMDLDTAIKMNFECVNYFEAEFPTQAECEASIFKQLFVANWTAVDSQSLMQRWDDDSKEWVSCGHF